MPVTLEVYVERGCFACRRAADLAAGVRAAFPKMEVNVIDLAVAGGTHRHLVVAAPTYILDGRLFSLGNPDRTSLHGEVARLLAEVAP